MDANYQPQYPIGQQFMSRGKHPRLCTVIDILKTFNSKGECVRLRYVATHEFIGQTVTDYDVLEVSITRSLMENNGGIA